jgi:hypothetical protein
VDYLKPHSSYWLASPLWVFLYLSCYKHSPKHGKLQHLFFFSVNFFLTISLDSQATGLVCTFVHRQGGSCAASVYAGLQVVTGWPGGARRCKPLIISNLWIF